MIEETPMNATALLLQTRTSSTDSSVSPKPRWSKGVPPTCENAEPNKPAPAALVSSMSSSDDDEPSPNTTKLLLESHTSTDGHISPKPRWTRGNPNTETDTGADGDKLDESSSSSSTTATVALSEDGREEPLPTSLRPGGRSSGGDRKCYMAWRWLLEDEAASEPRLQRPTEYDPVVLPKLMDAERELLYRNVELRLLEVGRQSTDIPALVEEYLRFMFLRKRLGGMLTLDPSPLVDVVWQAHITLDRAYVAFCEHTFGGEGLECGVLHREVDASQPMLYENTVGSYEHFFGAVAPAEWWPAPAVVVGTPCTALDGKGEEEEGPVDVSGRRTAFVRTEERKFHFAEEG
ncbi:unnamed protein product [Ectocarpus sp. CCAP 1310/34]|nr:unnamed protein product [Ectocarpus sp. CCAP 1310/34]